MFKCILYCHPNDFINNVTGKVKLHELVGALKNTTSHGELKKQLNRVQKKDKVLETPLSKPEQERV